MKQRLAALCGMAGPVIFVAVFMIAGWLRPGYDPVSMYVSELSIGPNGWIQIANFVVLGLLLLGFSAGVALAFRDGYASKAGPTPLAIIGVALIGSGLFVTDPATIFQQMSRQGQVHGVLGAIVFSLAPISCLLFFRRFRSDRQWRALQWPTLAVALLLTALIVLLKLAQSPSSLHPIAGLIQRLFLITYLAWLFSFAGGLYRRGGPS